MRLKPATHLANLCADSGDRRGVPIAAIAIFADPRDMPDIEDFIGRSRSPQSANKLARCVTGLTSLWSIIE